MEKIGRLVQMADFSDSDRINFLEGDFNTQRLILERYFDLYDDNYLMTEKKSKRMRNLENIYNIIMEEYERVSIEPWSGSFF